MGTIIDARHFASLSIRKREQRDLRIANERVQAEIRLAGAILAEYPTMTRDEALRWAETIVRRGERLP